MTWISKARDSHDDAKYRARCWLERMGYFVLEEVNIGNRIIDVLGIRLNSPRNVIGIECGRITNKKPPPENMVIFHLPYGNFEPYRWSSSKEADASLPKWSDLISQLLEILKKKGFSEEKTTLFKAYLREILKEGSK